MNLNFLLSYFSVLSVSFHEGLSVMGFVLILVITNQLVSGTMLSFSLIPDPMLVPIVRDEEDLEDLYTDDFFWLHERGVDLIFLFSWVHLWRKLYLYAFDYEHESTWKSGVFTFLFLHVVTFFGLVLCCTHLSEITLLIAVNIMNTFFMNIGKFYWWLFTDKQLNTDTLVRLAYLHYITAFFALYLGVLHAFDMHYDWKTDASYDGIDFELVWWDEALSSELIWTITMLLCFAFGCWFLYEEPEAITYELFMWGDIGLINDIRFYGVAPHWYFRPYMAWLLVCPYHNTGVFGLIFFFWLLFLQPVLHGLNYQLIYFKKVFLFLNLKIKKNLFFKTSAFNVDFQILYQVSYFFFIMCSLYCTTFLPYGRFYNRVGGNIGMLLAYMFLFFYLTFGVFRRFVFFDFIIYNVFNFNKYVRYLNK